jgi:FkbM family methyltransferase
MLNGEYEPHVLSVLSKRAPNGGVLFDVGAHTGYYSAVWIKLGGSLSEAIEPLPANREVLRSVIARNKLDDSIHVHPYAASDTVGVSDLVTAGESLGRGSTARLHDCHVGDGPQSSGEDQNQPRVEVETKRIDDLVEAGDLPPPDIVKIDVEGAEARVLSGALRTLARRKPWVICEIHGIEQAISVTQMLCNSGYRLNILGETKALMVLCLAVHKSQASELDSL